MAGAAPETGDPPADLADLVETDLVDGHCHSVLAADLDAAAFGLWCGEADRTGPVPPTDSQVGLAIRRWCAPLLGLPAHAPLADYLARRTELGAAEVTRRLLGAAGLAELLVDTGLDSPALLGLPALGTAAGARVHEVVRLEHLAEQVAASGVDAAGFAAACTADLQGVTATAPGVVAVKSIAAYRCGLDLEPGRPTAAEVRTAAGRWLTALEHAGGCPSRLTDPVLARFMLWSAVDLGLPVQLHTGFGDRDLALSRADPLLLQPWYAAVEPAGVPVVLLHCYPYQRQAGWLAQVFPHVYVDVGLTVHQVGARAEAVLAEFCELAPFGKLLFSTDGYGLPELFCVGAAQFRHAFARLLCRWLADGALSAADAQRIAAAVGAGNARRLYRLDAGGR